MCPTRWIRRFTAGAALCGEQIHSRKKLLNRLHTVPIRGNSIQSSLILVRLLSIHYMQIQHLPHAIIPQITSHFPHEALRVVYTPS